MDKSTFFECKNVFLIDYNKIHYRQDFTFKNGVNSKNLTLCWLSSRQQTLAYSGSCWEEYHGDCPREKRGPGELDDLQGSAPMSSRMVHPDKQQMEQRRMETSTDGQAAPD